MDETFTFSLDYHGEHYEGTVTPSKQRSENGVPIWFRVTVGKKLLAYLCCGEWGWSERDGEKQPQGLVSAIGNCIMEHYET